MAGSGSEGGAGDGAGSAGGGAGGAWGAGLGAPPQPSASADAQRETRQPSFRNPVGRTRFGKSRMAFGRNLQTELEPRLAMRFTILTSLLLPAWGLLFGCSADKSQVALTATVQAPELEVQTSSVGADATGQFSLVMALGEYASDATEVKLGSFSIQRDEKDLLSPLGLSGAMFPVSLDVGKRVTLPLTFIESTKPSTGDALCQAPVQIRGTLMDSLSNDHPTVAVSGTFMPSCP